jgi:LytS/YehU family sensor histidine kinase
MNPHFIFNALNVIQSFVYAGEKEQASHLIGKFSDLVRQTLQFSRNALITLEEEIDFIRAYVELEMNRMAPDLSIQYEIDPNVPLGRIQLPPLLIQPFVENALRHGLYHKEGDRWLRISVEQKEKVVLVQIDDNGVGRTAAKSFSKDSEHLSFASGANAQRMALLNQLNDLQIDLRMLDKVAADGAPEGTTVQITITSINTP